jgi:multimeric flavodoxin WrbA
MSKVFVMYSALNDGTKKIAEEVKNKAEAKGAEVVLYDLDANEHMEMCMGCKFCKKIMSTEFGCPLKDFVYEVYDHAMKADTIISVTSIEDSCLFGTQRYKNVINRLQVSVTKENDEGVAKSMWEGKGYFTIGTYEDNQANVPAFQMVTAKYGPYYKASKSDVIVCKAGDLSAADKIIEEAFA